MGEPQVSFEPAAARALPSTGPVREGAFSTAATSAVRCVVQAHLQGRVADTTVRAAVRSLCAEARRREMRVEQVLIALKGIWMSLPETRRPPHAGELGALNAIVLMCINEFYAPLDERAAADSTEVN